MSDEMKQ